MSSAKPNPSEAEASGRKPSAKARDHATASSVYSNDPKFKKYTQQVDKCLVSFDNVHEWADFISFLKQLLKTFQAYMQFKEIPKKLVVSKRLSQCLNPALPTGVHQRALDVYSHIFAVLGSEGLQRDLALWSSGLFPFFEYAATSVKPTLLNLFDTYYSPLQDGLRPIMKSFILALLPGLEEETGEFFDKVLALLDRLSGTVSPSFFLQNIWLIMLTSPSARGTSINFLSRRLPRLNPNEDIAAIVGRDIGLMIRAFSAALEDDDLLVRRGTLDILLQSLRMDSVAVKQAAEEDRVILMRAATSVVLRRDLSLNRRIYSWLLGPEEQSQSQITYLKAHGLQLLSSTLQVDMFSPSTEYAQSRPFKIFISLLDKWEIGSALTEVLVLDAFKAIKLGIDSGKDTGEDMSMTASTLYEAVEPYALWRQLLKSVFSDLETGGSSYEGLHMVLHLLSAYHQHDEEIESIHLPISFAAILEFLLDLLQSDSCPSPATTRATLELLLEIFKHIPASALLRRPSTGDDGQPSSTALQGPYSFACNFYNLTTNDARCREQPLTDVPFVAIFQALVQLNMSLSKDILGGSDDIMNSRVAYIHSVTLLTDLVDHLQHRQGGSPVINWDPTKWLSTALDCVSAKATSYPVVDSAITAIIQLHQADRLQPNFSIDQRATMTAMVEPLLSYLRPEWTTYHMRAVSLIWLLEGSSTIAHIESIISQTLSTQDPDDLRDACEAFGVLWRLTDDNLAPGFRLKVPIMIVLDTLKTDNPNIRRVGETWMRCSLKSYLRVLDPILYDLHDPQIRRLRSMEEHNGRSIQAFRYERPFDQRYTGHVLESLLSIVKFGGQGFGKIARSTPISRSSHAGLLERLQAAGNPMNSSYMDVIVQMLLQFLQSEPKAKTGATMHPLNVVLQSTSVDLLQAIIVRGEIDIPSLQTIESVIVEKLFLSVHTHRLDLQNKLLHALHSIISAFSSDVDVKTKRLSRSSATEADGVKQDQVNSSKGVSYTLNPLLLQTLLDGLSVSSNRPVLQHWLDFVLMTVPQFQDILQGVVNPLTDCLCRQLRAAMNEILLASTKGHSAGDVIAFTTDADLIMLLTALERLVSLSLAHIPMVTQEDEEAAANEKTDGSGLLGYVSNVFSSDGSSIPTEDQFSKASDYRCLRESIRVLYAIWNSLVIPSPHTPSSQDESLNLIFTRSRTRCRRVLEHLFRGHAAEVLECIIDCWSMDSSADSAFDLVDVLTPNAQGVVHMICESITIRTPFIQEKAVRRQVTNPNVTELTLFDFLEQYARRLEGPLAVQVWGRFSQLARDIGSSLREFKVIAFSALRSFTVLADKLCQTTVVEDRRIRKELQDIYTKLLDICLLVSRSPEGTWIRKTSALGSANGRDSPQIRDVRIDEKMNASSTSLPDSVKPAWGLDVVDRVNIYLASDVLPNLRKFLADSDKVLAACNNIVSSVVNPAMKGRSRPLDVDENVLSILREMTRLAAAMKAWRPPIVEVLNDNRCFNSTPNAGHKWRLMVKMLFDTDKTALTELLSRVTTAPSANIFTNREYEMLLRSLNLRRLSYVLLAGEKNHFLTQLPTIQEKLVDTLRNVNAPIVQSEVYLCIRVLLCRLSPHNLSSFWPVILTELYRLFEQLLDAIPPDGSEELGLILSASKLLDLLLVLQTEEFQIHQWIFITDTVDAIYRPDDCEPEALLDRLAEVVGDLPAAESTNHLDHGVPATPTMNDPRGRKPMLQGVRSIDSIRDLGRFFSHASIASYESVYNSGGNIDWEAVEQGLLEDMFDGR